MYYCRHRKKRNRLQAGLVMDIITQLEGFWDALTGRDVVVLLRSCC
jgi:hypothetical protein